MAGKLNLKFTDYSNEASTVGLEFTSPADGAAYAAILAARTAAITNISSLSIGALTQRSIVAETVQLANPLPTDPYAQRELKWFIPLRSAVLGEPARSFTIPVAKLVGASDPLVVAGSDLANLSAAEWAAFLTWLNADNIFFPGYTVDGTPYLVGRNI